ncbi:transposable element Tcb2 transposase [Trichonephila clavipes]|nr:transposable element Tcb2 transposase [Trichonephila clavipes]
MVYEGAIFQQDNDRPHTARVAQDFVRDFQTLPWPARSPDLSPVEHVWDQLKRQMPSCHSVHDLELAVQDLWAHLPQDNISSFLFFNWVILFRLASCIEGDPEEGLTPELDGQADISDVEVSLLGIGCTGEIADMEGSSRARVDEDDVETAGVDIDVFSLESDESGWSNFKGGHLTFVIFSSNGRQAAGHLTKPGRALTRSTPKI